MPVAKTESIPGEVTRGQWSTFFIDFSKRNESRATRLETFSDLGAQEVERNLPLSGISIEENGPDAPRIEIMLGGDSPDDERHLTHIIARATHIFPKVGANGIDEALEIEDANGVKSLLSFESFPELTR